MRDNTAVWHAFCFKRCSQYQLDKVKDRIRKEKKKNINRSCGMGLDQIRGGIPASLDSKGPS